jgi:hypothetical protein
MAIGTYKLYENKSSLDKRFSRYVQGGTSFLSGDKVGWWERRNIHDENSTDFDYKISNLTAGHPDRVAAIFFGNTELEWVILQYNNIVDVNEEFTLGTIIKIPNANFISSNIVVKPAGTISK